ncbi:MAG: hypothetical protein NC033_00230 [Clostridiales bacterium]|nr:hypothetical protein [Clostridiales bacterium]
MKMRTKIFTSVIAFILSCVMLFIAAVSNSTKKEDVSFASIRTMTLSDSKIDSQSILSEFEDAELKEVGSTICFEGYKTLDVNLFSEIDNISENDLNEIQICKVKYNFSYDTESNVVTLSAEMHNEKGEIEIDRLSGYAFINSEGNIDALMNIDGETVFLSEMQEAGLIQNCGWFSRLFKKIVVAVVAVVAVAAVAAVVVATAGAGMAAVIAAGAVAGAVVGGVAGGLISYSEYGKLDWRWIVGGIVIGGALGAVTGWGVGTMMGAGSSTASVSTVTTNNTTGTSQIDDLINAANKGELGVKDSLINKGYLDPNSATYRKYYDYYNTISKEIMQAKSPIVEQNGYLKWVVEGAYNSTCGKWELVIDPINKSIAHFLFFT